MVKQTYQCVHLCCRKAFFQFLQVYSFWERFFLQHVTPGAALRRHLIHRNRGFYTASFYLSGKRYFSACNNLQINSKNFGHVPCLPLVFPCLFKAQHNTIKFKV